MQALKNTDSEYEVLESKIISLFQKFRILLNSSGQKKAAARPTSEVTHVKVLNTETVFVQFKEAEKLSSKL